MPTRNFDDPNDDEDMISPGEYQGQTVKVRPDGAEWRESHPPGIGRGVYVWEYECPVCRTFYFRGAEPGEHKCSFCEITHQCLGSASAKTPRRAEKIPAPPAVPARRKRVIRAPGAPTRRSATVAV